MRSFILISLLFIQSSFIQSSFAKPIKCKNTQFKYIYKNETQLLILRTCKVKDFYLSESCYKKGCKIKKRILKAEKPKFSPVGSPHFRVCHKVGGIPILGEIQNLWSKNKGYESIALCFNRNKTDFVDGGYIIYRKFRNP